MKKSVAIWNINSFAEFYLQIEEKYHREYLLALEHIRSVRSELQESLSEFEFLRVIPSQANFITCEVKAPLTAADLTLFLLEQDILIKDLSTKTGFNGAEYIRVAVRNEADNNRLLVALREVGKSL